MFSKDGSVIACCVADSMTYGLVVDGTPWETLFPNANNFILSDNGAHTAVLCKRCLWGRRKSLSLRQRVFRGH